jgi:hypothetical protein
VTVKKRRLGRDPESAARVGISKRNSLTVLTTPSPIFTISPKHVDGYQEFFMLSVFDGQIPVTENPYPFIIRMT